MEENAIKTPEDIEREQVTLKKDNPSLIKEFFTEEENENIKDLADLFGQSEQELKKEFGSFKAKKIYKKLNYFIDNRAKLKTELKSSLETAVKYGFYGVTVLPSLLKFAKNTLKESELKVRVLINYPYGEDDFKTVKRSAKLCKIYGADEIAVMLSSFTYKNFDNQETIKQIKKLKRVTRSKKLIVIIDGGNFSRTEIEKVIKLLISCGIRYILLENTKARLEINVLEDAVKLCEDKIFIECKDKISCAEQTVSTLSLGIDFLTSEYAPEIAIDLSKKINATSEINTQPLDKTDKE